MKTPHKAFGGVKKVEEMTQGYTEDFITEAERIGAEVYKMEDLAAAIKYIASLAKGVTMVPDTALARKYDLCALLAKEQVDVYVGDFRNAGYVPDSGVSFCNFCMADSGTVVLDSTAEDVRLATMLPEKHFVIVDPVKILKDNLAAAPIMARLHEVEGPKFIAYISGPSRTADVERVLTIGCHGPRELHILLVAGISQDYEEF